MEKRKTISTVLGVKVNASQKTQWKRQFVINTEMYMSNTQMSRSLDDESL